MLGLLTLLLLRSVFLVLTLVIFALSVRRLLRSKTANAWLYAATAVFALLTFLGLLPWLSGMGRSHPVFFVFAAIAPGVWYGVVSMCNATRHTRYDSELERTVLRFAALARRLRVKPPLVLEDLVSPEMPQPVFRHTPRAAITRAEPQRSEPLLLTEAVLVAETNGRSRMSEATRTLLGIARGMRRNASSEGRRPKLLPPPRSTEGRSIPFLQATDSA